MKVLWLNSTPINQGLQALGLKGSYSGAGWVESMTEIIGKANEISLSIAFFEFGLDGIFSNNDGNIDYYAIPASSKDLGVVNQKLSDYLRELLNKVNPDIVHIFGTERPHTLEMLKLTGSNKTIISITGLVSVCAQHFFGGLSEKELHNKSMGDRLRFRGIKESRDQLVKFAATEIEAISMAKHVIGRTTWDYACVKQMNPQVTYHTCNEMLRRSFYTDEWKEELCERHSIFVSQGAFPYKGLHMMLAAMPIILNSFPDAKLYVAGSNITKNKTLRDKLRMSSYGKCINKMISEKKLQNKVIFMGELNEQAMKKRFIESNVFVLPSSIENSSNSLGEAMILGVPIVAACVGGVQDLLRDKAEGFIYPFDETYMLAYYVCKLFSDSSLCTGCSEQSKKRARITHNQNDIVHTLIEIYHRVIERTDS